MLHKSYEELLQIANKEDNPLTYEKNILRKRAIFDTKLSKDNTISCATYSYD